MQRILLAVLALWLHGCSINQITVRAAMPMVEGGITALYREADLQLAEAAFAPNIELMEGMLVNDPDNQDLRQYAAQAYYGYGFGFVEDQDKPRAARMYRRGMAHGIHALRLAGMSEIQLNGTLDDFSAGVKEMDVKQVPLLFWTASNWAKWIDMNRHDVAALGELPRAVALMERVLELDQDYFLASPHLFMGVYYGGRSPMLGGDFMLSQQHFDKARASNQNKMLIVDVMQAQYLERQRYDQAAFHSLLTSVLAAPDDIFPEQMLANAIAKAKAKYLLEQEDQWF